MIKEKITVRNKKGIHTRPAAVLVKTAAKFSSNFTILKDGMEINGKSIIGVMSLAAEEGAELTVCVEGEDERDAFEAIRNVFERGFDEE
jgi:phosphocarrier protein HPr